MTRILFCLQRFSCGGLETSLVRLLNALAATGKYKLSVLFCGELEKNFIFRQIDRRVNVYVASEIFPSLNSPKPKNIFRRKLWRVKKFLAAKFLVKKIPGFYENDFLVDYQQGVSGFCLQNRSRNQKILAWIHGSFPAVVRLFEMKSLLEYDGLICLSDEFIRDFNSCYPLAETKLFKLYNIMDFEKIRQLAEDKSNLSPDDLDLLEKRYMVHVSRLDNDKDIPTVIAAFEKFQNRMPCDLNLYLVGDGSMAEDYKRQAEESGLGEKIRFLGTRSNPFVWMKHSQMLILSSYNEGLPCVIPEAMSCGTRVCASRGRGGLTEVMGFGKCGPLFEPGNSDALAEIMAALQQGDFKAEAYATHYPEMLANFSSERVIAGLEQILLKL